MLVKHGAKKEEPLPPVMVGIYIAGPAGLSMHGLSVMSYLWPCRSFHHDALLSPSWRSVALFLSLRYAPPCWGSAGGSRTVVRGSRCHRSGLNLLRMDTIFWIGFLFRMADVMVRATATRLARNPGFLGCRGHDCCVGRPGFRGWRGCMGEGQSSVL